MCVEPAGTATGRERVRTEPGAKRVRAYVRGVAVFDTTHPLYVWEHPRYPCYYIPLADVRRDLLVPSDTVTHSPSRGDARHFSVRAGGDERVDAAWQYTASPVEELRGHVRFAWEAMDAWFEEDDEVYTHARDPYTRIDILASSRPARVELDGIVLADSSHPYVLFETRLRPRWYFAKSDVRMDLLLPADHVTHCPYKGRAEYWSVRIGERLEENLAWSYRTPLPESERIAGLVAFYDERVDLVIADS